MQKDPSFERYEKTAREIVSLVEDKEYRLLALIGEARKFIIVGKSGCGKSMAIDKANEWLGDSDKIGKCYELRFVKTIAKAEKIVSENPRYSGCGVTCFTMIDRQLAEELSEKYKPDFPMILME